MALRAILVSPEFLFRVEQDPAGVAPRRGVRDQRLPARLAPFVLPVELDSRRRASLCRRAGRPARSEDARSPGPAHARRPALRDAHHELRRPVALPAQPRLHHPGYAPVPGLRRQLAPSLPPRNRAVLRIRRTRGSLGDGLDRRQLHFPKRAPRQALLHPQHLRQPLPPRRARSRLASRRPAAPRQHPHRHLLCRHEPRPSFAASGCLDNLLGIAAASSARPTSLRSKTTKSPPILPMRERLAAHQRQPRLRRVSSSSWIRSVSRSKPTTPSAAGEQPTAGDPIDVFRGPPGRQRDSMVSDGLQRGASRAVPQIFVGVVDRETFDLRPRPRSRTLRRARRSAELCAGQKPRTAISASLRWYHGNRHKQHAVPDQNCSRRTDR